MKVARAALLTGCFTAGSALILSFVACGRPSLPIVVQKMRSGLRSDVQPGERVPIERISTKDFAGAKPGFYALRTKYEFELFRADLPKSKALPPKEVNFENEMIVAGYSSEPEMDKLEIQNVIDTPSGLHIYALQYSAGEGCPAPQAGSAFDLVSLPRSDRALTVHLDTTEGPACKATAPKAKAVCRIAQTATWQPTLSAAWQSNIECEAQMEPGARAVVDRNWFIGELAKGSSAKLTMARGGSRISFPLDVLGRYVIKLEAVDADGKRGESAVTIDSVPPNDETYVQIGWSGFTSTDDVTAFPRLETRLGDVGPKGNVSRALCTTSGLKQLWCDVTTVPAVNVVKVADTPGRYSVAVRYLDDRYKGMPVACVRVFRKRALQNEVCDDNPRKAGESWEPGIIQAPVGMFEHLIFTDAGAEGGTPEGGTPEGGAGPTDAAADATLSAKPKTPAKAASDASAPKSDASK